MTFSAKTDIGLRRSVNQDSFRFGSIENGAVVWAVVCDGMGGMAAGNIASDEAATVISAAFSQNLSPKSTPRTIGSLLKSSVEAANAAVYDMALKNEEYRGMGTTVVSVVVKDEVAYFVHAGDSRAYLLSDGELSQVTTDHSIVQSMVESGQLTADEAKHHPNKNIITRAVGVAPQIALDFYDTPVKSGDIILLCTDGLTNCVETALLHQTALETEFDHLADRLITLANQNGGSDNITVVAIKIE